MTAASAAPAEMFSSRQGADSISVWEIHRVFHRVHWKSQWIVRWIFHTGKPPKMGCWDMSQNQIGFSMDFSMDFLAYWIGTQSSSSWCTVIKRLNKRRSHNFSEREKKVIESGRKEGRADKRVNFFIISFRRFHCERLTKGGKFHGSPRPPRERERERGRPRELASVSNLTIDCVPSRYRY